MGKERMQTESFVVHGWFEAVFQDWEQTDTIVRPVHVFSTDIRMEFEMKKCGILTMKREKVVRSEGIKLPESEVMKDCEKEEYTHIWA